MSMEVVMFVDKFWCFVDDWDLSRFPSNYI